MPNGEQGEKEGTGETDGAANRRGHAEREGKRGMGRGENLQNSKEYFRNRITATSSIDREIWIVMASCYLRIFFAEFSTSKTCCIAGSF